MIDFLDYYVGKVSIGIYALIVISLLINCIVLLLALTFFTHTEYIDNDYKSTNLWYYSVAIVLSVLMVVFVGLIVSCRLKKKTKELFLYWMLFINSYHVVNDNWNHRFWFYNKTRWIWSNCT